MGAVLHTLNLRLFPEQLTYIANHAEDRVVIVDSTLIPLLARVLPDLTTVGTSSSSAAATAPRSRPRRGRAACTAGRSCSPASRPRTTGPRSTSATRPRSATRPAPPATRRASPTRHRSIYLHSMQVCMAESVRPGPADARCSPSCRCSTRWRGACRTRRSCPARRCIMPDRFLQAAPLAAMIEAERPTLAGAVPTIWTDLLAYLDASTRPTSPRMQRGHRRRLGLPAGADARVLRAVRRRDHPRLGHDRDVAARLGVAGRRPARPARRPGPTATPRAGCRPASRPASSARTATVMPNDGKSVGELEVRGPWITADVHRRRRAGPGEVPTTAGCAPATSACCRPTAS